MNIGIYQFFPQWGKVEENTQKIINKLSEYSDVDLWVLPELCTTGYQFISKEELASLAEEFPAGKTAQAIMQLTKEKQNVVILGVAEKEGDNIYNSSAIFEKGKFIGIYRKIHLFYKEKNVFTPGNKAPEVYDVMGAKVGPMICFDWIFPEIARSLALQGAELLAHSANLVLPYCQAAMITRSIENRVFTATANRLGAENRDGEELTFTGRSQFTDYKGNRICQLGIDEENVLITQLDLSLARDKKITELNDLFLDRKMNLYRLKELDV